MYPILPVLELRHSPRVQTGTPKPPEASLTIARTKPADTKLIVCVWHPFPQWRADEMMPAAIRKRWPEMRVVHLPDFDRLPEELPDTDIFVGASLRPDQFAYAKKLKWIHSTAAGVNQLMYPALKNSGVLVTNPSGLFSPGMAEHVIGMMVLLARNFMDSVRYQDKHIWAQNEVSSIPGEITELSGELMLIVGYGSIGREVARRASCFDMRIWGMTRSGKGDASLVDKILPISDLDAALPHADWVVLAAPDTPDTQKLFSAERFARMKRGARLINMGRGTILDEDAFVARAQQRPNPRRRHRRRHNRTDSTRQPALDSEKSLHHSPHRRRQRPPLAPRNRNPNGAARTLVRQPGNVQRRRRLRRLLT